MNCDSSFFALTSLQPSLSQSRTICTLLPSFSLRLISPKKSYVNNPLKTSEISKLLKSKKILKRQASLFFSRFSLKQHIAPKNWWSQTGSNRRPPACKAGALPAELWPPDLSFFRPGPFPFVSGRLHTRLYVPSLRKNEKVLDEKNPASAFLSGYYLAGRKYPSSRSFQPKPRAIFVNQDEGSRRLACQTSGASTPSHGKWWVWEDLNFRPHPYQGCALTN